jgi:hypothetical protein
LVLTLFGDAGGRAAASSTLIASCHGLARSIATDRASRAAWRHCGLASRGVRSCARAITRSWDCGGGRRRYDP